MNDCYCDYGEAPSVLCITHPTARKPHRCDECSGTIESGQKYERIFGVWEGAAGTFKCCHECEAARDFLTNSFECFCWYLGGVIDAARELIQEKGHLILEESPGVLFQVGRLGVAWRRRRKAGMAEREARRATLQDA